MTENGPERERVSDMALYPKRDEASIRRGWLDAAARLAAGYSSARRGNSALAWLTRP
jgi:hypothetical protein